MWTERIISSALMGRNSMWSISAPSVFLLATLIASPALAQGSPQSPATGTTSSRSCQRYEEEQSTLVTFDCATNEILESKVVPWERFNPEENSVELIDSGTGTIIKSIPAAEDFPQYGLSQSDLDELAKRCEDAGNKRGDDHRLCVANQEAERVEAAHLDELMAIPNVDNVAIGESGQEFVDALILQVECPRDVPAVEARAPKEIEGIPIKIEPEPVGTSLVAMAECTRDANGKNKCYDISEECDPYLDPVTCEPHCWNVRKPMRTVGDGSAPGAIASPDTTR